MSSPDPSAFDDLDNLVDEPRETLDIEVKDWLDLTDNDHRATIAKEIIALANHGGGYLVIGFEELPDGSFRSGEPSPPNLDAWSQDAIQGIAAKYIDPGIQCRVLHRLEVASGRKYPVIAVPGGHRVPVRAKVGSPDAKRLVPNRVYIRRPGPNSEEPKTAEEWDAAWRLPSRKGRFVDPECQVAAASQPCLISRPVRNPVARPADVMTASSIVFERHGRNIPCTSPSS